MEYQAAVTKLNDVLVSRTAQAENVINHVMETVPQDVIARGRVLDFNVGETGNVTMGVGARTDVHSHALGQVLQRASIPGDYFRRLTEPVTTVKAGKVVNTPVDQWKRELAEHTLREHYKNSNEKYLIRRVVRGDRVDVRAFLSDQFRRLDSRPLLEAFITSARAYGAKPYQGVVTDVKVALKALLTDVHFVNGEAVCIGIEFSNSDFGSGTLSVRLFLVRLICLNGATLEDVIKQRHLGSRLEESIEYSRRTYELDTQTMVSALKDTVRDALAPARRNEKLNQVSRAVDTHVSWEQLKARWGKTLGKGDLKKAEDAFTGPDVINLPPGETKWRASNVLSWLAHSEEGEKKLEFERLAGQELKF